MADQKVKQAADATQLAAKIVAAKIKTAASDVASSTCIFGTLTKGFEADLTPLLIASAAQFIVGFIYYGFIVNEPWEVEMNRDKNVKRFGGVVMRYNTFIAMASSFAANFVRSLAVLAIMGALGPQYDNACMWFQAGLAVFVILKSMSHVSFWEQRPTKLIIITYLGDFVNLMVGSYVLYLAKHW